MSGRISYRKVLGEKNPADLMTKHMTADLAMRHLETLNMQMADGRAETAPTIDSFVQSWYIDIDEGEIDRSQDKSVSFNKVVEIMWMPATGRMRPTPKRGSTDRRATTTWRRRDRPRRDGHRRKRRFNSDDDVRHEGDLLKVQESQAADECKNAGHAGERKDAGQVSEASTPSQTSKPRWADLEDSDEESPGGDAQAEMAISSVEADDAHRSEAMAESGGGYFSFCLYSKGRAPSSGVCTEANPRGGDCPGVESRPSDRLSGEHRKGRPVPTACVRGKFAQHDAVHWRSRPSAGGFGRRRSVECGGHARTCTRAYVQAYKYASADSHVHAVLCTHDTCERSTVQCFSPLHGAQAR